MDAYNIVRKHHIKLSAWIIFMLIMMSLVVKNSEAAEAKILFVKSGTASVYNKIINTAQQRINNICQSQKEKCIKPSFSVESINNKKLHSLIKDSKWDLIVTVGTKAAVRLNRYRAKTPALYALIPSHSYPAIRKTSSSRRKSAIYIDQPIRRQLQLIKTAMPGKKKVGVLLGGYSGISKKRLQRIMRNMGLEPVIINVSPNSIGSSLEDIYSRTDALLAQPDPSIYNKKTVMTVLLSSYRHNVPVFGYSAAFVRSGATAAIYSSPQDIGRHIGEETAKFLSSHDRKLSPPAFPKYFSVNTNRRVLRSLNISMSSTDAIKTGIIRAR